MSLTTYSHQIFTTDNLAHTYSFIGKREKIVKLDNKFLDTVIYIDMTQENCEVENDEYSETIWFTRNLTTEEQALFNDSKRTMIILNNALCFQSVRRDPLQQYHIFLTMDYSRGEGKLTFYVLTINGDHAQLQIEPLRVGMLTNDLGFITNEVEDLINYYTKTEINNLISSAEGSVILTDPQPYEEIN